MKKVCILTSVHPVFDGRIFHKEAKSLSKAGYEVIIIAQHNKEEIIDGIRIVPLPVQKNRLHRMTKIVWRLFRFALKEKADIYHFHDPELIPIGILLKLKGKKIIYDVHENYRATILGKKWIRNKYLKKIISFFYNVFEQITGIMFNKIVAATPYIAKRFPKNRTVILRNLPILKLIDDAIPVNYKKNKPIIIYAGGLASSRGIKKIIQVMEYIGGRAEVLLLGKWENEEFRKECENLRGWKYTKYLGFKKLEEVYTYMKISDIGISTLYPTKNRLTALLIKSFEYMACSLPIVMSNFAYWQGMFGECALFADPYDSKDVTNKILYLLDDIDKAKTLGKKGRELIEKRYNWELESKKLLNMYKDL